MNLPRTLDSRSEDDDEMDRVLEQMQRALTEGPAAVAFDADGTLWSGDVGEDFFLFCVRERLLKAEASEALHSLARRFKLRSRCTKRI